MVQFPQSIVVTWHYLIFCCCVRRSMYRRSTFNMNAENCLIIHLSSEKKVHVQWTCTNFIIFFEITFFFLSFYYHTPMLLFVNYNSQKVFHSTNAAEYTALRLKGETTLPFIKPTIDPEVTRNKWPIWYFRNCVSSCNITYVVQQHTQLLLWLNIYSQYVWQLDMFRTYRSIFRSICKLCVAGLVCEDCVLLSASIR